MKCKQKLIIVGIVITLLLGGCQKNIETDIGEKNSPKVVLSDKINDNQLSDTYPIIYKSDENPSNHQLLVVDDRIEEGVNIKGYSIKIPERWMDKRIEDEDLGTSDEDFNTIKRYEEKYPSLRRLIFDRDENILATFSVDDVNKYYPEFTFLDDIQNNIDEAIKTESDYIENGDLAYFFSFPDEWVGAVYKGGYKYSLVCRGNEDNLLKYEELFKTIFNSLNIDGEQNNLESIDIREQDAASASREEQLIEEFEKLAINKEVKSIKELNYIEANIFDEEPEILSPILDNSSLYISARTILYGLVYADSNIIDLCLEPHKQNQYYLNEYFRDFNVFMLSIDDYKIVTDEWREYTNEYIVYVDIDNDVGDMQFKMVFYKIGDKYYFDTFKRSN